MIGEYYQNVLKVEREKSAVKLTKYAMFQSEAFGTCDFCYHFIVLQWFLLKKLKFKVISVYKVIIGLKS